MSKIKAEIIADSLNQFGQRITTFVCTFPRIVLAELNTHRMFSRNSASSRAIPFKKMLSKVWNEPFVPIEFMKDHSGMQGNEYFTGVRLWMVRNLWLFSRVLAIISAWTLSKLGLTKQLCNRILEPYLYHTAIITATEWENFFALRADKPAEIHIQELAYLMLIEYNNSIPVQLKDGEWHIPFGDNIDEERLYYAALKSGMSIFTQITKNGSRHDLIPAMLKIATARCARVSYGNFEGKDDYEADIKLHDRLAASGHWSPMEHCAQAMSKQDYEENIRGCSPVVSHGVYGNLHLFRESSKGWCGNFRGFKQYRKTFEFENKTDNRVIKK